MIRAIDGPPAGGLFLVFFFALKLAPQKVAPLLSPLGGGRLGGTPLTLSGGGQVGFNKTHPCQKGTSVAQSCSIDINA